MYPVFAKRSIIGEKPLYWVDRDEKLAMMEDGSALSFKGGKAIRLTRDKMLGDTADIRDTSAQMGPWVSEAFADGMPFARAIVQGWAPCS